MRIRLPLKQGANIQPKKKKDSNFAEVNIMLIGRIYIFQK